MAKNKIIREVIVASTCRHPAGAPKPSVRAAAGQPDVILTWECGTCGARAETKYSCKYSSGGYRDDSYYYWALQSTNEISPGREIPSRTVQRSQLEEAGW